QEKFTALPLKFTNLNVSLVKGRVSGHLDALEVGPLEVGSLDVDVVFSPEWTLVGEQRVTLKKGHIDASKLNELMGNHRLATDLDVEVSVEGTPDALELDGDVSSAGGNL